MEISSQDIVDIQQRLQLPQREHVVILHEKLAKRKCDRYILNLGLAYHQLGYRVTLFTSQYSKGESIEDFKFSDKINIKHSAWWIPRSVFGLFRGNMSALKAACMAFRIIFYPPREKPSLIILDISVVALYILHLFTKYKMFYVESFEELRNKPDVCEHSVYAPSLLEAKFIKLADDVIVESVGFSEIFKNSLPSVTKEPVVLYPPIDIGLWNEPGINIQRIIPDLLDNTILFLSIGKFRRSSNFKLALDSFELLLQLIDDKDITKRFQLVIAGNCKTLDEKLYYNELVATAKERICASQVTFLKQLPIIHEKTLIMESAVMIYPSRTDVQADFILKAMSLGKPIIATNKGIAPKLLQNRISGITTEACPNAMAQVMRKLMMSPHLQSFMGEIAKDAFQKNYSFKSFCGNVNALTFKRGENKSIDLSVKTLEDYIKES